MLLSSASSRVLVNGAAGPVIRHRRGLRQGDPLSPFLFILAMEPLQQLLINAVQEGALSKIKGRVPAYRTSMYADDVAIFLNPVKQEVLTLRSILRAFGDATGLRVNFSKSTVLAINSTSFSVPDIAGPLGAACATFRYKFLGLPLSLRKLRKIDLQPLIDKIFGKTGKLEVQDARGRWPPSAAQLHPLGLYGLLDVSA